MKTLKVQGIQRSGTNWAEYFYRGTYAGSLHVWRWDEGGWKHGNLTMLADVVVVMVKHPLYWLDSIIRFRNKARYGWVEYVRHTDEIEVWNRWYRDALETIQKRRGLGDPSILQIVRYEDALEAWHHLDAVAVRAGVQKPGGLYLAQGLEMDKYAMPSRKKHSTANYDDPAKFVKHKYIRTGLLEEVRDRVDNDVMEDLGYRMPTRDDLNLREG